MELIIKTKNSTQDKYILAFLKSLKELGISFEKISSKSKDKNGESAAKLLKKIALKGGVKSIENPVKWQTENRKDRTI